MNYRCDLLDSFKKLKALGYNSILVEGGASIIQSVIDARLCDQVVVTIRPCFLGGFRSMTKQLAIGVARLHSCKAASIGGDIVMFGRFSRSGCYDNNNNISNDSNDGDDREPILEDVEHLDEPFDVDMEGIFDRSMVQLIQEPSYPRSSNDVS